MAKTNPRDPNLRAATVARVEQLVKGGLTKAAAFEKISSETGRAKDAVQMLYYRAVRAQKGGKAATRKGKAPKAVKAAAARPSRGGSQAAQNADFQGLLKGLANSINALLVHFEKTVEENEMLKEQAQRLNAITSLLRGR